MGLTGALVKLGKLKLSGTPADWRNDYDAAAGTFEDVYTPLMAAADKDLLERLSLQPGQRVLELGCGTGHVSRSLATLVGERGHVTAIDSSAHMLKVAAEYPDTDALPLEYQLADMSEFVRAAPDHRYDAVVCAWSICYGRPTELLRQFARILVPGGIVGVIETRHDAYASFEKAFRRTIIGDPSLLVRQPPELKLPRNEKVLRRWFEGARLTGVQTWSGHEEASFPDGTAAVGWMVAGAQAAGFFDAIDITRRQEFASVVADRLEQQGRPVVLRHTFVGAVAGTPA